MKMESNQELEDELRPEYDFSKMKGGVRGKYVERYRTGTNIVLLDPDVAQAFPTSDAVNEALRMLMQIAQRQKPNTALEPTSQM
jgi:hypothetical protein